MAKLTVKSPAKLNLYLEILGTREDGYHALNTIFESIDLFDTITLREIRSGIRVSCSHPGVPCDENNLAHKAARAFFGLVGAKQGIEIHIEKNIPPASGLGGGSSNAACVLLGLNSMWKTGLARETLMKAAADIGMDVPFFTADITAGAGTGRGERIDPLNVKCARNYVIVNCGTKLSTRRMYALWDEWKAASDSDGNGGMSAAVEMLTRSECVDLSGHLYNSFEPVAEEHIPEVKAVKQRLASLGMNACLMSGSGPAVFGIARDRKEAGRIRDDIATRHGWMAFAAATRFSSVIERGV